MYFLCSRVLSDREEKTENLHAVLAATGANVIVVVNDAASQFVHVVAGAPA